MLYFYLDYPAAQGLEQRMNFNPSLNSTFDEGNNSTTISKFIYPFFINSFDI